MCTTPVVWGLDTTACAIPPRVVVWDGASAMLCAQLGSTSNVTGTPSTGRPWASCTRTINSVDCVRFWTLPTNPTTISKFDMTVSMPYALRAHYAPYQEAMNVTSVSNGRQRVCDSHLCAYTPRRGRVHGRTAG